MAHPRPYGDDFIVQTPSLDRLEQRLYNEQRQREQYRLQQDKMLDDEFSRNLSGIRDADIGDLTKAYGDFKIAHMNMMRKKGGVSPEEQLEILRKKAAVYDVINSSKEDKAWEDAQSKQIMTDRKGIYADDAHQQLIKRRQTPLSKLDRTQDEKLLYPYSVPDLAKEIKTAKGDEREVPIMIGVSKTDPLKDEKEVYKAGNPPDKFANRMLEGVLSSNKGRNFIGIMNNKYNDQELEDLKNRYAAKVNDPKFIAVYGEPKPLPALDTELGKAVAIRTMEEFANMELKPTKITSELNQDRAKKAANKEWDRRNRITFGQHQVLIAQNKAAGVPPPNTGYLSDEVATEKGENINLTKGGKSFDAIVVYQDKIDPDRMDIINPGRRIKPTPIKQLDGSVKMGYYVDPQTGDWNGENGTLSREAVKDRYINKTSPSAFKAKVNTKGSENTRDQNVPKEQYPLPKGKPRTVKQNGYTYTWNTKTGRYE